METTYYITTMKKNSITHHLCYDKNLNTRHGCVTYENYVQHRIQALGFLYLVTNAFLVALWKKLAQTKELTQCLRRCVRNIFLNRHIAYLTIKSLSICSFKDVLESYRANLLHKGHLAEEMRCSD